MNGNIDNTAAFLGTIAVGEAVSDPLANTGHGLRTNQAAQDLINVFAHIRDFWVALVVWGGLGGVKGSYELMSWAHTNDSGWFMALGVFLAFVFWVGMTFYVTQQYCWFVRAKMLTRIFPVFSTPWKMLTQCHGYSGKTAFYFSTVLMLIYPITFGPALLLWDGLRLIRFALTYVLTGGNVRFGGTQFIWYKKQAQLYNAALQAQGKDAAEFYLRQSAYGLISRC